MTTICWDGKILAADKRARTGESIAKVTKIWRLRDGSLFGGSGDFAASNAMREWVENGCKIEDFPPTQKDKDQWARCIWIRPDGYCVFENHHLPMTFEEPFFATGSGKQYALAAMYLGKNAIEAVEVACVFDADTGNGVDSLCLK